MLLKNFLVFWDKFYQDVFKVSLTKNWITINFLKILFYVSIWIVLVFAVLEYFVKSIEALHYYWNEFKFAHDFLCTYDDLGYFAKYGRYPGNDPWEINRYYPAPYPKFWFYIENIDEYFQDVNYWYVAWNRDWFYYYEFLGLLVRFLVSFICIWIILIFLFICIHIYFGLNNVYKDYIRDINVTLKFFYLFISIFILINLFVICFDHLYKGIIFDAGQVSPWARMYMRVSFIDFGVIEIDDDEILIYNIVKINIVYIFTYLFINFLVSKNKIIFSINSNYLIYSSIGFCLLVVGTYYIFVIYWSDDFYFFFDYPYFWKVEFYNFCKNYLVINWYGIVNEVMILVEFTFNIYSGISKDLCILMYNITYSFSMFIYTIFIGDMLVGFLYFIYDLLFS